MQASSENYSQVLACYHTRDPVAKASCADDHEGLALSCKRWFYGKVLSTEALASMTLCVRHSRSSGTCRRSSSCRGRGLAFGNLTRSVTSQILGAYTQSLSRLQAGLWCYGGIRTARCDFWLRAAPSRLDPWRPPAAGSRQVVFLETVLFSAEYRVSTTTRSASPYQLWIHGSKRSSSASGSYRISSLQALSNDRRKRPSPIANTQAR